MDELLKQKAFAEQPWRRFRVKDGDKGPMVWEVKHAWLTVKNEDGLPGERLHLLVARDVLNPEEVKYFVSNAPEGTPVAVLVVVAFSRWRVERCFEDHKGEVGLDHYEGRRYVGLKRHLALSAVSYLFLTRMRQELGGKKAELTECQFGSPAKSIQNLGEGVLLALVTPLAPALRVRFPARPTLVAFSGLLLVSALGVCFWMIFPSPSTK